MDRRKSDQHQNFLVQQLISENLIDRDSALQAAKTASSQNQPLIFYLVQNNLIKADNAAHFLSRTFELPLYDISLHDESLIAKEFLDFDFVKKFYGLPILQRGDNLFIAIAEPNVPEFRNIGFLTQRNVEFVLTEADKLHKAIEEALRLHEGQEGADEASNKFIDDLSSEIGEQFEDFEVSSLEEAAQEAELISSDNINETPIVRFVNKILVDAIRTKSSDIHFEPYEKVCRVRYRLDGVLREVVDSPKKLANSIVARLKVMANLDISEHRVPQDGRFRLTVAKGHSIDVRMSTCPTIHGEKVVMRLLDAKANAYDISSLGMNEVQREHFLNALKKPQGMILVTGPTGSGKTISLYTGLQILNTPEVNISTVEDPVEIYLHGVNQVHVNIKAGMTFSGALRSFLRQDPDIIMVGEIRDLETAEIGIKAAQTGHLVLSTLHTNSAPLTISRLVSMGVPNYNITSSVTLVMAQRLVRRLCPHCKKPLKNSRELLLQAGVDEKSLTPETQIFEPGLGCSRCQQGYKGRVGVYEVMPMSDAMSRLIMAGGNALEISAQAKQEGVLTLRDAGIEKVMEGLTSITEVDRVTIF